MVIHKGSNNKIVPFFANTADNMHCLQACTKSVLGYFFPNKTFSDEEVDNRTGQTGGWTWLPPVVVWFDKLGLRPKLFSQTTEQFDYRSFSQHGLKDLQERFPPERFEMEMVNGSFKRIEFVQQASRKMLQDGLWEDGLIESERLAAELNKLNVLAIAKTFHPWLSGEFRDGPIHYVVVIKSYNPTQWRVHDPGVKPFANRKVPKNINGHPIFGETVLIELSHN